MLEKELYKVQQKLDMMWDNIQRLKHYDELAAQVLYEKYKQLAEQYPPVIPTEAVHAHDDEMPGL